MKDIAGLDVLFLFGSRARGDAHDGSDWDFAYLGSPTLDVERLLGGLVLACGTDRVDVVDLSRAGGLLRYRVARDGYTIFERAAGTADRFRVEAAEFLVRCRAAVGTRVRNDLVEPSFMTPDRAVTGRTSGGRGAAPRRVADRLPLMSVACRADLRAFLARMAGDR